MNGIVDSAAGENADFKYSDVLLEKAGEGLVWDEANLTAFLTKPKDFMDGTKMAFAGLRKEQEIMDVIAYLKTFEWPRQKRNRMVHASHHSRRQHT